MEPTRTGWQTDARTFVDQLRSQPGGPQGPARPPPTATRVQLQSTPEAVAEAWTGLRTPVTNMVLVWRAASVQTVSVWLTESCDKRSSCVLKQYAK